MSALVSLLTCCLTFFLLNSLSHPFLVLHPMTKAGRNFGSCSTNGTCELGSLDEAWIIFVSMASRNLISWNSMIAGFQIGGLWQKAIELFNEMRKDGIDFDCSTLISTIASLCGINDDNDVELGLQYCFRLHCLSIRTGFFFEARVSTALIKAYSNLGGGVLDCYRIFLDSSGHWDIVSWTGIISTFVERIPQEALSLFCQLLREGWAPDCHTLSSALKACAGLMTERHAAAVHLLVIRAGFEGDTVLANALIHSYARCGSIALSKQVFDEMEFRDIVSWNSMLKAYALHGQASGALELFSKMNVKPDAATFVALLSACSHAGLLVEGANILDNMSKHYGVVPALDHYACVVDMFGRAGRILEAKNLLSRMPMEPDSVVWSALLGACRKHNETGLGKLAAAKHMELEPGNSLGYILMSNIYCSDGNFNEAGVVRKKMKRLRVRKRPGLSWTEVGNQVHEFASGGLFHPQREAICGKLETFIGQLKHLGYVPETSLALHDVEEEQKTEQLYHHSEKHALAFALMAGSSLHHSQAVIKIMKNIRICLDCHNFMKFASKLIQKQIIVRDSNRFHHFKDGECSCKDYW
ncbi:hypothetical protein Nepgr_001950 [Nepenthes gracilis]|uniref:DYW domain-containing protein n=1 Tax=Nepenthes gracilis TaxID=150966 RepID=A0AAD3RXW2_NEPGR|nr:hypothetical protein Nepgr_001950 [Nepenthes gracilis]